MTTITIVLLWSCYWSRGTRVVAVLLFLCASQCELSQCEEVGGKFKKGRGMGEVYNSTCCYFICATINVNSQHRLAQQNLTQSDEKHARHDIVVLAWGLSVRCSKR